MERKEQVFNQRLTNGMREMAVESTLMGYNDTYEFAKELGQHYKIFGLYNTDNIAGAYPVDEVIINNNGKTIKVSTIKKAENLQLEDDETHEWSDPIAIVSTDGTPFIFSYNKKCSLTESDINEDILKDSGTGLITECIAGVYDINGVKTPNQQDVDIIQFNGGSLAKGCSGIKHDGKCAVYIGSNYTPINCGAKSSPDYKYCYKSGELSDYSAGAVKACVMRELKLPTKDELLKIYADKAAYGLSSNKNRFYSSTYADGGWVYYVNMGTGAAYKDQKVNPGLDVICIEE